MKDRGEAQVMSSWTDEDEDGGTHPSSPLCGVCGKEETFSEASAGYGHPCPTSQD